MNNLTITTAQYMSDPLLGTNTSIGVIIDGQEIGRASCRERV